MKILVNNTDLRREVKLHKNIVDRNNTIPIIANVLIEAGENSTEVMLSSTNLDVSLVSGCKADIQKPGSVALPAEKLLELTALFEADADIDIQTTDGKATISSGGFRTKIGTMKVEEFPNIPDPNNDEDEFEEISCSDFRAGIANTSFARSKEDVRFFLAGTLLDFRNGKVRFVSTDGYRLPVYEFDRCKDNTEIHREIIFPKALNNLKDLVSTGAEVEYWRRGNHLFFSVEGRTIISKKIDSKFPEYERVIPVTVSHALFNRKDLELAIKKVTVLAYKENRIVNIAVHDGNAVISCIDSEFGISEELIPVDTDIKEFNVRYVASYILDVLKVVKSDEIRVDAAEGFTNTVWRSEEDDRFKCVVVPTIKK